MTTPPKPRATAADYRAVGKSLRKDSGWQNALSGLGTARDKTKNNRFRFNGRLLQPEFLDGFYAANDLAQTIVSAVVQDAMREGFELKSTDRENPATEDEISEAKAELDEYCVGEKVEEGAIWGRLYGRGGLLLVVKGAGMAEEPLEDGAGELLDIVVVYKRELSPATYYQDPLAEKFGLPETYFLQITASPGASVSQVRVHETRLILFGGVLTPKRIRAYNEGADLSVLQAIFDLLSKVEGNFDSVCAAMTDMSQGVIKIKGLIDAIAAGKSEDLAARFELMDQMKSMVRTLPLDADSEDFDYIERAAMSGIGDLLDKSWTRLAAACTPPMPVTRLLGISPAGLNATGEGDRVNWYDRVRAYQRKTLKPAMDRLVKLILGPGWEVSFPDLEKQDPLEQAQIQVAQATSDSTYVTMGALTASEVAMVRFGKGHWSAGYDGIEMEPHEAALEKELDDLANPPEQSEPDPALEPGDPNGAGEGSPASGKQPGEEPGSGEQAGSGAENDPQATKVGST